jgi:DNA gyrase subunit B
VLRDCISANRAGTELLIVRRGAVGTLANATRDPVSQAVLALTLPASRKVVTTPEDVLDNPLCRPLIGALGVGLCLCVGHECRCGFDLGRLRYGKIIVAADESAGGAFLRTQVLGVLRQFMRPIVVGGYVYTVALPPPASLAHLAWSPSTRQLTRVDPE